MKTYLKEIVSSVFEIYAIELLSSMSIQRGMTSLTYVTILSRVHWHTGSMYAKVCNDSLNITIVL